MKDKESRYNYYKMHKFNHVIIFLNGIIVPLLLYIFTYNFVFLILIIVYSVVNFLLIYYNLTIQKKDDYKTSRVLSLILYILNLPTSIFAIGSYFLPVYYEFFKGSKIKNILNIETDTYMTYYDKLCFEYYTEKISVGFNTLEQEKQTQLFEKAKILEIHLLNFTIFSFIVYTIGIGAMILLMNEVLSSSILSTVILLILYIVFMEGLFLSYTRINKLRKYIDNKDYKNTVFLCYLISYNSTTYLLKKKVLLEFDQIAFENTLEE